MKKRIDQILAERQLAPSREKAKALIMSGNVYVGEQKVLKAGEEYEEDAVIRVTGEMKYVSRGGLKLEKAMEDYGLTLTGKTCADIGASTGGFTDCMLHCTVGQGVSCTASSRKSLIHCEEGRRSRRKIIAGTYHIDGDLP